MTGDSATETAFIDGLLRNAHFQPVTLLEVACGTGGVLASLAGSYQVTGLDISPGMLAVARRKLPAGTPLHLADMSRFELGVRFDAVICVYHGINHLLGFPAWQRFFGCACRHLNDGGVLIFDILTAGSLESMASAPEAVEQFGDNYLHIKVRACGESVFDWHIEVRERQPGGGYESLTEVIRTATFPPEKVQRALRERFASITVIESDGGVSDDGGSRIWFACTKATPTGS